jgi:RNA polymerase sigma-70 factor, ECF subfamily
MAHDDDAALMQAVGRGDRKAFAILFDRHHRAVVRFCFRFAPSLARAEELAQDVFVKLYRSASSYRPEAQFKTFLYRVATNHCLNELRRKDVAPLAGGIHPQDEVDEALERAPAPLHPGHHLEAKELEAVVSRALEAMTPRERAAFTMCRFEGLAYRDIAQALESSESAVKSLIHRATVTVMRHVQQFEQAGAAA